MIRIQQKLNRRNCIIELFKTFWQNQPCKYGSFKQMTRFISDSEFQDTHHFSKHIHIV